MRDGNLGWRGLAAQTTSSARKNPEQATKPTKERYPQGCPTDSRTMTHDKGKTLSTIECSCGRICKNVRGLKIHQCKMRFLTAATMTQRTEVTSGKTQEELGPEATHSAQSLLVSPTSAASSSPATTTQETVSPGNPSHLKVFQQVKITE